MALCLASSLIARKGFSPYDQLVRYKWWFRQGYMSSTGQCFDIGNATRKSICTFEERQKEFAKRHKIPLENLDYLLNPLLSEDFDIFCSEDGAAGNGGLMRLSPVPLFFHKFPVNAVEYSGVSAKITHGDVRVYDACRFYGALIVAAIRGETKAQLLDRNFYQKHKDWFKDKPLHADIQKIVEGSYKKKKRGYEDGIRGKGFVVDSLEAALWAFHFDGDSFEKGALYAVNLGDDTDTTAAIYGQLAGAYYGYNKLPRKWIEQVYAKDFVTSFAEWIIYEGQRWLPKSEPPSISSHEISNIPKKSDVKSKPQSVAKPSSTVINRRTTNANDARKKQSNK